MSCKFGDRHVVRCSLQRGCDAVGVLPGGVLEAKSAAKRTSLGRGTPPRIRFSRPWRHPSALQTHSPCRLSLRRRALQARRKKCFSAPGASRNAFGSHFKVLRIAPPPPDPPPTPSTRQKNLGECSVFCKVRSELLQPLFGLLDPAKHLRMCSWWTRQVRNHCVQKYSLGRSRPKSALQASRTRRLGRNGQEGS